MSDESEESRREAEEPAVIDMPPPQGPRAPAPPARWGLLFVALAAVVAGIAIGAATSRTKTTVPTGPRATPLPRGGVLPPTPPAYRAPLRPTGISEWSFVFVRDSTTLTAASGGALDRLADAMRRSPTLRVRLTGYSNETGDLAGARRLAEARAYAVKTLLEERGIDGERMQIAVSDAPEGSGLTPPRSQGTVGADLISR